MNILDAVKLDMTRGHLHMTGVSGRSAQRTVQSSAQTDVSIQCA